MDVARKVVGVGSVGTRAFIVLLEGRDAHDPLFLQIKEATASVLEASLPRSRYRQHGERVVQGQRMMQAASDIFLGWTKGLDTSRHFYWRQLRDMKGSALVELMAPATLRYYAQMCGWTLARAHARAGDPVVMAEYLGRDDAFDQSITRLLRTLRRPERAGLRAVRQGDPVRAPRGDRGCLSGTAAIHPPEGEETPVRHRQDQSASRRVSGGPRTTHEERGHHG